MNDSFPDPQQLLLLKACLSSSTEETRRYWSQWHADVDIDHLDEGSNRLLPLLFRKLEALHLDDPEIARLRGIYRYHWVGNHFLIRELQTTLATLSDVSVEVILLKGAALINRYYRDPGIRPMSDLDIMVRPQDLEKACEALAHLGWSPRVNQDIHKVCAERLVHAVDFIREKNGRTVELDVHWTPLHRAKWIGVETPFWKYSQPANINGVECRVLDSTDQLLHVCLHGGSWNAMPPFRWIVDACWILQQDHALIDWDRLLAEARTLNGFMTLRAGLNYLHENLSIAIPQDVLRRLSDSQPTRLECLEHRLLSQQIPRTRLDLLLLLEWLNHSRAHASESVLARCASFPSYLKLSWKLAHWHQVPFFVLRRLAARFSATGYSGCR